MFKKQFSFIFVYCVLWVIAHSKYDIELVRQRALLWRVMRNDLVFHNGRIISVGNVRHNDS